MKHCIMHESKLSSQPTTPNRKNFIFLLSIVSYVTSCARSKGSLAHFHRYFIITRLELSNSHCRKIRHHKILSRSCVNGAIIIAFEDFQQDEHATQKSHTNIAKESPPGRETRVCTRNLEKSQIQVGFPLTWRLPVIISNFFFSFN